MNMIRLSNFTFFLNQGMCACDCKPCALFGCFCDEFYRVWFCDAPNIKFNTVAGVLKDHLRLDVTTISALHTLCRKSQYNCVWIFHLK